MLFCTCFHQTGGNIIAWKNYGRRGKLFYTFNNQIPGIFSCCLRHPSQAQDRRSGSGLLARLLETNDDYSSFIHQKYKLPLSDIKTGIYSFFSNLDSTISISYSVFSSAFLHLPCNTSFPSASFSICSRVHSIGAYSPFNHKGMKSS